jgi:DNA polymerase-4
MGRSADIPRVSGSAEGPVDDAGCSILHVDMDAFFASVEIRRNPALRGKPVVVGGSVRGVVAAASYEARRFGVRSAMPMTRALRLCPHAVVVPPTREAYSAVSGEVMAILRSVTGLVQPLSLDEAFLDVSGATRLLGSPSSIARLIRRRVAEEVGLTCSVGVAPTKFVAKVASARCKPDGLLVVPAGQVLAFLHPLPVTVLWGVGARTGETLRRLGIRTIADLAGTPAETLRRAVGEAAAAHLAQLAAGVDPRPVVPDEAEKSISAERTVESDLTDREAVRRYLLRLSDEVGCRLRDRALLARTVGIKIRFADFTTVTRARTLHAPTDATGTVFDTAADLYDLLRLDRPRIRLVGVKAEGLLEAARTGHQLTFDDLEASGSPTCGPATVAGSPDAAIDAARRRFGSSAVGFASLLDGRGA